MGKGDDVAALEAALHALEEEHQAFLYRVSHDLREPLRKINAFSELLRQDLGDDIPDIAAEDLSYILDGGARMQQMLDGLLLLARANRRVVTLESVPVRACVEQALLYIEPAALSLDWEPLPTLYTDRALLLDFYQRGLDNARRHAKPDGPLVVRLTAEEREDAWVLGIADNGVGIPEADRERVFRPFERLGRPTEGAGMGLAIVRKQLALMGAHVCLEPAVPGAHLRLTLPKTGASRS